MAQIGLVTLGIFCLGMHKGENPPVKIFFTSSEVKFQKMVLPGDLVWVESKKLFFRLRKLQCEVTMKNQEGQVVCSGTLSGMMVPDQTA
jgi:3-hydroxyacyl-[acyl-carrier-protein] dehydratase